MLTNKKEGRGIIHAPAFLRLFCFFSLHVCRYDSRHDADIHTPVEFKDGLKAIAKVKDEFGIRNELQKPGRLYCKKLDAERFL